MSFQRCWSRRSFVRSVVTAAVGGPLLAASPLLRASLIETLPRVKRAVVAVGTYQRTRSPAFVFRGSGFVVGDGRLIATNAHVLPENIAEERMETLAVMLPGGDPVEIRKVRMMAVDRDHDLAILALEGGGGLPTLSLRNGDMVPEGQQIAFTGFPIGNALGVTPVTHRGIVSAITPIGIPQGNARDLNPVLVRRLAGGSFPVYQLDATAYPGNSGSPMFDPDSGEVLGIVNMVFVKSTKENVLSDPSGISYAIPVSHLRALLASVR